MRGVRGLIGGSATINQSRSLGIPCILHTTRNNFPPILYETSGIRRAPCGVHVSLVHCSQDEGRYQAMERGSYLAMGYARGRRVWDMPSAV